MVTIELDNTSPAPLANPHPSRTDHPTLSHLAPSQIPGQVRETVISSQGHAEKTGNTRRVHSLLPEREGERTEEEREERRVRTTSGKPGWLSERNRST